MKIALEFIFYFGAIIIVYYLIYVIFGMGNKTVSIKKINKLFKKIDKKYEHFLDKKVKNVFLDKENYKSEINQLADLCLTVLKPEIDGIYALVRLKVKPDGGINFSSKYFTGVIALTEALMLRDTKKYKLTEKDFRNFMQAFKTNLVSDITERVYINELDE
jgi:hypothetical protein